MGSEFSVPAGNTRASKEKPDHKKEFFQTKADHGFAKRVILHKTLQGWFRFYFCEGYQKVCYVDGFAGEGTYGVLLAEDLERATNPDIICKYGSPLIALHNVQNTFMSINEGMNKLRFEKDITKENLLSITEDDVELLMKLADGTGAWKKLRPPFRADMYLIEPDEERIEQLKTAMQQRTPVDASYDHEIMKCRPHYRCKTFAEATGELQGKVLNNTKEHPITGFQSQIPTFSFIDPFGYKQISMKIVQNYIGENKTVLINVMIGFIHRFKSVPAQGNHITALFGSEKWRDIPEGLETAEKYLWYAKLYESQLKENGAEYTLSFAMKDKCNKLKYYMIFATNELRILKTAKEALNRVTQESQSFEFSAYYIKTNQKKMEWSNDQNPNDVAEFIWQEYKGKECVPVEEICDFVYTSDTPYIHRKEPLKILYKEGKVSYTEGCEAAMRGTFPHNQNVCVNFSSDEDEALKVRYFQNPNDEREEAKGIWYKFQGRKNIPVSKIKPKWKKSLKILLDVYRVFYSPEAKPKRKGTFPTYVCLNFAPEKDILDYEDCNDIDMYDNDVKHTNVKLNTKITKRPNASNHQISRNKLDEEKVEDEEEDGKEEQDMGEEDIPQKKFKWARIELEFEGSEEEEEVTGEKFMWARIECIEVKESKPNRLPISFLHHIDQH